jgi:hypothetical protein
MFALAVARRVRHDGNVFVETIHLPRGEWERWHERLRYTDDPPEALVATIAWDSGDGLVMSVNVWDTPGAIADFFMEFGRSWNPAANLPTSLSDAPNPSRSTFEAGPRARRCPEKSGPDEASPLDAGADVSRYREIATRLDVVFAAAR